MNLKNEIKALLDKIYNGEKKLDDLSFNVGIQYTLQWFKEYQGDEPLDKMITLYNKLVNEEKNEIIEAWENGDIVELLDGFVDWTWVALGKIYFETLKQYKQHPTDDNLIETLTQRINEEILPYLFIPKNLFILAWLEVAYSNWTKPKKKRDDTDKEGKAGKIIKGSNFVKPNINKVFSFFKKIK